MNSIQKFGNMSVFPLSLALMISSLSRIVIAESPASLKFQRFQNWQISQKFIPPNRKAPRTTAGGASRGGDECDLESKKTLTSLIPPNKLGLTLGERPTFYWFVRQMPLQTAQFSLLDDQGILYKTTFKLPSQSGIIGFTLPTQAPSLKVNKQYHWYLAIACSSEDPDQKIVVDGWVERIQATPDLSRQLANTNPQKLSQVYAANGIWYEVLHTLAQQRLTDPSDRTVMAHWQALLSSVGLKNLLSQPLINMYNSQTQ